jgi:hypothetical protein
MEKFKKEIIIGGGVFENKYDRFIYCNLESRSGGDWDNYEVGDVISYKFDLLEKCNDWVDNFIDDWNYDLEDKDKVLLEDLKEYVGEGICFSYGKDDWGWYNVEFDNNVMIISFIEVE